ncbi:unnamed protein product [Ceutorhynchus assimilis]|uniref:Uncharacterized protein n=1 Tax=Ceutorhynchus assimilis TaxID=467358 RepID=A0A9N9MYU4_9CUCU|nr:unnamed protein product [Ceutorhynchus assimilis]
MPAGNKRPAQEPLRECSGRRKRGTTFPVQPVEVQPVALNVEEVLEASGLGSSHVDDDAESVTSEAAGPSCDKSSKGSSDLYDCMKRIEKKLDKVLTEMQEYKATCTALTTRVQSLEESKLMQAQATIETVYFQNGLSEFESIMGLSKHRRESRPSKSKRKRRVSSSSSSTSSSSSSGSSSSSSGSDHDGREKLKRTKRLLKKRYSNTVCDEHLIPRFDPNEKTLRVEKWVEKVDEFGGMGIIHTPRRNIVEELVKKMLILKEELFARCEGMRRALTVNEIEQLVNYSESAMIRFGGMGTICTPRRNIEEEFVKKMLILKEELIARCEGMRRALTANEIEELVNYSESAMIRCSIYNIIKEDFNLHLHKLVMEYGRGEIEDPLHLRVGPVEGFLATRSNLFYFSQLKKKKIFFRFGGMGIIHTPRRNIVEELVKKMLILKEELIARCEGISEINLLELNREEVVELKSRLDKFNSLSKEYDEVQDRIEALVDDLDQNEEQKDRLQFENLYFKLSSQAKHFCNQFGGMGIIHTLRINIVEELVKKMLILKEELIARCEEVVILHNPVHLKYYHLAVVILHNPVHLKYCHLAVVILHNPVHVKYCHLAVVMVHNPVHLKYCHLEVVILHNQVHLKYCHLAVVILYNPVHVKYCHLAVVIVHNPVHIKYCHLAVLILHNPVHLKYCHLEVLILHNQVHLKYCHLAVVILYNPVHVKYCHLAVVIMHNPVHLKYCHLAVLILHNQVYLKYCHLAVVILQPSTSKILPSSSCDSAQPNTSIILLSSRFGGMGIIHTPRRNIVEELVKKMLILKEEIIARCEGMRRALTA